MQQEVLSGQQRKTVPPMCQPAPSTKLSSIIYIMHGADCVGTKQAMQQPSFSPYLYLPDFFLLTPRSEWSSLHAAFQPALGCKMPLPSNQLSPAPSLCPSPGCALPFQPQSHLHPVQAQICICLYTVQLVVCYYGCGGVCARVRTCARAGRHICTKAWKADI